MSHPSEQLLDYAYGELAAPERTALEKHLAGCPECTRELDGIRGVRKTFAQLAPEPAPGAGLESLLAYAAQSAERAKVAPRRRRLWALVTPVASLLALCLVVILADRTWTASERTAAPLASAAAQGQLKNLNTFGTNNEPASPPAEPAPMVAVLEKAWVADAKDEKREEKQAKKPQAKSGEAAKGDALGALVRRDHMAGKKASSGFDPGALDALAGRGSAEGAGVTAGLVGGVAGGSATDPAMAQRTPPPPPPAPPAELAMAESKPSAHRSERAKLREQDAQTDDRFADKEEAEAAPATAGAVAMAEPAPAPTRAAAPAAAAMQPVASNVAPARQVEPAKQPASGAKAKTRSAPAAERERLIDALALATPAQVPGLLARLCELDTRDGRVDEARAECSRLLKQYGTTAEAARARRALSTLPLPAQAADQAQ